LITTEISYRLKSGYFKVDMMDLILGSKIYSVKKLNKILLNNS